MRRINTDNENDENIIAINKKTFTILTILAVLVLAALATFSIFEYNIIKANILDEKHFYVEYEEDAKLETMAENWITGYIKQYQKDGLPFYAKLKNLDVSEVKVLDEATKTVQINFTTEKVFTKSTYFKDLDFDIDKDGKITCEWVIKFVTITSGYEENTILLPVKRERPAAYDADEYISSGKAEEDKINAEKEIEEATSTYIKDNSGDFPDFIKKIEGQDSELSIFTHIVSDKIGFQALAVDRAMGENFIELYKTTDGGKNWSVIASKPDITVRDGAKFLVSNENLIYYTSPNGDGSQSTLYVSKDGGLNFSEVTYPEGKIDGLSFEFKKVFDTPDVPSISANGTFTLIVGQGSDGDVNGNSSVRYISKDAGNTWTFDKEIK